MSNQHYTAEQIRYNTGRETKRHVVVKTIVLVNDNEKKEFYTCKTNSTAYTQPHFPRAETSPRFPKSNLVAVGMTLVSAVLCCTCMPFCVRVIGEFSLVNRFVQYGCLHTSGLWSRRISPFST